MKSLTSFYSRSASPLPQLAIWFSAKRVQHRGDLGLQCQAPVGCRCNHESVCRSVGSVQAFRTLQCAPDLLRYPTPRKDPLRQFLAVSIRLTIRMANIRLVIPIPYRRVFLSDNTLFPLYRICAEEVGC